MATLFCYCNCVRKGPKLPKNYQQVPAAIETGKNCQHRKTTTETVLKGSQKGLPKHTNILRVPKKGPKNECLKKAPDDRRRPDRDPKMDPKMIPKRHQFLVPFFLAALGATLGLSCAFLPHLGALLAPFLLHLGANLGNLGPLLGR